MSGGDSEPSLTEATLGLADRCLIAAFAAPHQTTRAAQMTRDVTASQIEAASRRCAGSPAARVLVAAADLVRRGAARSRWWSLALLCRLSRTLAAPGELAGVTLRSLEGIEDCASLSPEEQALVDRVGAG